MIIYVDIVFVENIIMNYLILKGIDIIKRRKTNKIRIICSSIIGAFASVLVYIYTFSLLKNILFKIVLSISMVIVAYKHKTIKEMCKDFLLFYAISFIIGGCCIAILYTFFKEQINVKNGIIYGYYPMIINIIAGIVGLIIVELTLRYNKRMINKKDLIVDLVICINNIDVKMKAFIDSGNTLKCESNHWPVIIVEERKIRKCFEKGGDLHKISIGFKSIGKQNGIMEGIIPDYIKVVDSENKQIILNEVVVGLYKNSINSYYSALIGLDILKKGGDDNNDIKRHYKQDLLQSV